MIIEIDKIPEEGAYFKGFEPKEVFEIKSSAEFHPEGPLDYELYVQMVDDTLIVRGHLSTLVTGCCARCTQMFSTTVSDSAFLRDYFDLQGLEEVDVTDDLREAILLNLPRFPLCNESCKGLCSQCGKDLNTGRCTCLDGDESGAWDALNSLNL